MAFLVRDQTVFFKKREENGSKTLMELSERPIIRFVLNPQKHIIAARIR